MNYDIHYLTEYRYQDTVTDNLNALRVQPATTSNQRCDEFHMRLDPEARIQRYVDYFGTEVHEFGISRPHDHLTIDVRARVVTSEPSLPPNAPWERLLGDGYEAASGEFLLPGPTDPQDPLTDLLAAVREDTPLATLQKLCKVVPDRFLYQPGATYVGSTVDDLLIAGAGGSAMTADIGAQKIRDELEAWEESVVTTMLVQGPAFALRTIQDVVAGGSLTRAKLGALAFAYATRGR